MDERTVDLSALPMAWLREERIRCRRAMEVAHLRSRQPGGATPEQLASLRQRADALTEELIGRYASDLDLVDSLLLAAYPHDVGSVPAPGDGGAGR